VTLAGSEGDQQCGMVGGPFVAGHAPDDSGGLGACERGVEDVVDARFEGAVGGRGDREAGVLPERVQFTERVDVSGPSDFGDDEHRGRRVRFPRCVRVQIPRKNDGRPVVEIHGGDHDGRFFGSLLLRPYARSQVCSEDHQFCLPSSTRQEYAAC